MSTDAHAFLTAMSGFRATNLERAVALVWFNSIEDSQRETGVAPIAKDLEAAGYGKQNQSRLAKYLSSDPRTMKVGKRSFRIRVDAREDLEAKYAAFADHRPVRKSNAILPLELFDNTRGYLEKVVSQINVSFDQGLYDCSAVMCRRLLETLVIELYENRGWEDDLKGPDGNYMMFSGLLNRLESDKRLSLSRNTLDGLKAFKRLGDLSAHNRRFNARADDITRIRDGIRVASEDLLHMSGLTK